jgi:hypothetical protein
MPKKRKDRFNLTPPERAVYHRELDAEARERTAEVATAGMEQQLAELERLRAEDAGLAEIAKQAQATLNELHTDDRFVYAMTHSQSPDHDEAKRTYRQLCEDATCHLPSDPKQAAFQQTMRGGSVAVRKPLGEKPPASAA